MNEYEVTVIVRTKRDAIGVLDLLRGIDLTKLTDPLRASGAQVVGFFARPRPK